ncbi:helix-turn-helix domain-containing protein [Streptomyces sp. NPDC003401]
MAELLPEVARFAAQLRMLKNRAGGSYESVAKAAGVGRSSLHRYCAGSHVPPDYGTVHAVAVACGASNAELRELHRLWALADAASRPDAHLGDAFASREPEPPSAEAPPGAGRPAGAAASGAGRPSATGAGPSPAGPDSVPSPDGPGAVPPHAGPVTRSGPAGPRVLGTPPRRRRAVLAGVGATAVLLAAALVLPNPFGRGGEPDARVSRTATASGERLLLSAACRPVVTMGQHDACVAELQRLLRATGGNLAVDSDFGPETLRRVTAFQALAGLPVRGIVDEPTVRALYERRVSMRTWPAQRVEARVRQVFTEAPDRAVGIARCQSFLDPLHVLPNTNGTRNWGVFQISDMQLRRLGGDPLRALDPEWNIQAAHRLWLRHRDFRDWPHCDQPYHSSSPVPSTASASAG